MDMDEENEILASFTFGKESLKISSQEENDKQKKSQKHSINWKYKIGRNYNCSADDWFRNWTFLKIKIKNFWTIYKRKIINEKK